MSRSLQKLLVGRKILDGKILPPDYRSGDPNIVTVDRFCSQQRFGEVFQVRLGLSGKKTFLLKVPAPPITETHPYIENEISKLELLTYPKNPHFPVIQKSHIEGGGKRLPFYLTCNLTYASGRFPSLVKRKPVSHFSVLLTFYLLAKAVSDLTNRRLVHGDIHFDTIKFYDKMPVIAHWSTTKSLEEIKEQQTKAALYGDPLWLPPEVFSIQQLEDSSCDIGIYGENVTEKTDVWGLGLLFMQYLTGQGAFDNFSPGEEMGNRLQHLLVTSHKVVLGRYRNFCKQTLEQHYLQSKITKKALCDEIYQLCWSNNPEGSLAFIEKSVVLKLGLDHLIATRDKLLSGKKEALIAEFYIGLLLTLFDICTYEFKNRVTPDQLVKIMETLFPNIAMESDFLVVSPYIPLFQKVSSTKKHTLRKTPPPNERGSYNATRVYTVGKKNTSESVKARKMRSSNPTMAFTRDEVEKRMRQTQIKKPMPSNFHQTQTTLAETTQRKVLTPQDINTRQTQRRKPIIMSPHVPQGTDSLEKTQIKNPTQPQNVSLKTTKLLTPKDVKKLHETQTSHLPPTSQLPKLTPKDITKRATQTRNPSLVKKALAANEKPKRSFPKIGEEIADDDFFP